MIVLVTGGSGCGKSVWAESLIGSLDADGLIYLATMEIQDEESERRVLRHRRQRAGAGYETIECPKGLGGVEPRPGSAVLLEDVPNLLANEMFGGGDWERIIPDVAELSKKCAHLIIVTNDVFSDGVRYDAYTELYVQRLALIGRKLAELADAVVEVVYSIPVVHKGVIPCAGQKP